ncbi:MAG: hypothetical protein WA735_24205, partial [Candidatus Acidiferrales bacterium]
MVRANGRHLHLRANFILQLRHLLSGLLDLIPNNFLQVRHLLGGLLHLAVDGVLQVRNLVGRVANLFLDVLFRLLGPVLGLLKLGHRAVNLIEAWREFLFELDGHAFENLLRGGLETWLNLLGPVRDNLIRLARHLLLLRGEQFIELLARLTQRMLDSFLELGLGFFGAMTFLLQSGAERFNGGGCASDGFVQRGTQDLRAGNGILLRLHRGGPRR